jgi:formylmethanofuran dehydrogenase subunit E
LRMGRTDECSPTHLAALKAFHGHLGPYVLAGMRVGRYALRRLGAEAHFGIEADVECAGQPPVSCFLDGVQFSTGCTLGKMNIRHHVADGVTATFRNCRTGEVLALRLRPEAIARAIVEMDRRGDEAGAALIEGMDDEDLMEEIAAS